MKTLFINKKIVLALLTVVSTGLFVFVILMNIDDKVTNLKVKNYDKEIVVKWDNPRLINDICMQIHCENEIIESKEFKNNETEYHFKKGVHGKRYYFVFISNNSNSKEAISTVFIDFNRISNMESMYIDIENDISPKYRTIYAPEGKAGISIIGNEQLKANMCIVKNNIIETNQPILIKARGNTSTVASIMTQFAITLTNSEDLFYRGNPIYNDNDYILLGKITTHGFYGHHWLLATLISQSLEFEWVPKMKYVNLFINDEYKGCYILIESVKRSQGKINTNDNGYLIQNNAYYWKTDKYFRTNYQNEYLGFTYKYPETNSRINEKKLKEYINEFENCLYSNNPEYKEYIDERSFAKYLLFNDILFSIDPLGTNMYLKINDFINDKKITIPCTWDFDNILNEDKKEEWELLHTSNILYYEQLLKQPSFKKVYVETWDAYKEKIRNNLEELKMKVSVLDYDDLQNSVDLTQTLFDVKHTDMKDDIIECINLIENRLIWIEQNIAQYR